MADIGTFRSALNGFNRQDVANYIAYLNNKHTSEVEQLNNRLQSALNRQQTERDLERRLSQAEARCAELEAELAGRRAAPAETHTDSELEAYRRAERTEREAKARAQRVYEQANAILADAALKAEEAAKQIDSAAQRAAEQLESCRASVMDTRDAFQETMQALYAIRSDD